MVENEFENLRKKWYDKKEEEWSTEVLFIAESPPAYSSLENYFYYTGDDADQRNLFGSLLSPLGIENDDFDSKSGRLKEFLKKYWLEDLFYDPIDDVDETDVGDHVKKLKKEIERINPDRILIMLPNKAEEKIESVIEYLDENIGGENINETLNNGDLIEKEKKVIRKLTRDIKGEFDIRAAPFPAQGIWKYSIDLIGEEKRDRSILEKVEELISRLNSRIEIEDDIPDWNRINNNSLELKDKSQSDSNCGYTFKEEKKKLSWKVSFKVWANKNKDWLKIENGE